MDRRISNFIAIMVTVVWVTSFVADILSKEYAPSPYVHLAMMAVVGAAFGNSLLKRGSNDSNHR